MNSLDSLISIFANAFAQEPDEALTVGRFLADVRDGRWARKIAVLREHLERGDRARYDERKVRLPAVSLSCHCLSRERDLSPEAKDVTHSGWLQVDCDLKDNMLLADRDAMAAKRAELIADTHVAAVFVGPSGEGVKALVAIDAARHKDSWFAAEAHFREAHGLNIDKATKDPMRLCFVSHDPDLLISEDFTPLAVPEAIKPADDVWRPPLDTTAADIAEMLRYVPPRPDYDTWLRIASAVWSVLPAAEGAKLLNDWSPEEKPGEYMTKHKARLQQINVGSLVHFASRHGFDARAAWARKRWAGRIRFAEGIRGPGAGENPADDTSPPCVGADVEIARIVDALTNGQTGDARLWCALRNGLRVWNIHAKCWMIYSEGVWARDAGRTNTWDTSDSLKFLYRNLIDSIRAEIAAQEAPPDKKDSRIKEVEKINRHVLELGRADYLSGVENLATRELHRPATAFDANPDVLVLANGTLDFAEGIFREHRGVDFATHRTAVHFNPDAECPKWHEFLNRCIPDVETRAYLARATGYCLTGRVHHDVLFFVHGKGANGKSTFFSVLKLLLNDLMTTVPIAALLAAKADNNFDYHKASMEGKRVVITDEIPEGRHLAESQIKALTGGDPIPARRPFEQPYVFMPTHKLWLMGNHKPEIKGTDEGIWRRVHMIPFVVTIPAAERRPRHDVLAEFAAELPGILNWALRGLLESLDVGLMPPPQVVEATREYREESDQFGMFLAECTDKDINGRVAIRDISECYKRWCEQNNERPRHHGSRALRKVMIERGWQVEPDRKNHPMVFGLTLKMEETDNVLQLRS